MVDLFLGLVPQGKANAKAFTATDFRQLEVCALFLTCAVPSCCQLLVCSAGGLAACMCVSGKPDVRARAEQRLLLSVSPSCGLMVSASPCAGGDWQGGLGPPVRLQIRERPGLPEGAPRGLLPGRGQREPVLPPRSPRPPAAAICLACAAPRRQHARASAACARWASHTEQPKICACICACQQVFDALPQRKSSLACLRGGCSA